MTRTSVGWVLLVVGVGWVIANRVLVTIYPESWGGPNIGGGLLLLIAYSAVLVGAGILARAFLSRRR